ncbi:MAG TPA: hypothetical protein DHV36_02050 [Desulfobacteraceae bacterium]|nr:hypothetical protein [Desulfobacteraceae bacterium]
MSFMLTHRGCSKESSVRQEDFENKNKTLWNAYDRILACLENSDSGRDNPLGYSFHPDDFPPLYRKVCHHYAVALSRQYSPALVTALHTRIMAGHRKIYKKRTHHMAAVARFFSVTFPSTFRANFTFFILALALFILPFIGTGIATYLNPDVIYSIMNEDQVADFEYMYDPENRNLGRTPDRQDDRSVMMFGFYIKNNISIGFRTFATGALAGLGTVFSLVYNGVILGGVAGHVTRLGFNQTFWPFVSGHGAFELTAIVICGMAGLILARAIVAPGNYKRVHALKNTAPKALSLVLGAAAMLFIAAVIEAFWSPFSVAIPVKYTAAALFWAMVASYLLFSGRGRPFWI